MKSRYPETKLDRAVDDALTRENKAVIEEERIGEFEDAMDRQWFRELMNSPHED